MCFIYNDQNVDDPTIEEDHEDENVPCYSDKLPQGCYYKSCSSSRQEYNKYYICQKSDCVTKIHSFCQCSLAKILTHISMVPKDTV